MENNTNVNKRYKDTVFRKLFGENKANALSLYNAINGTNYTEDSDFEYTTLDDVVYMGMKNDISFVVGTSLSLYEHQSTYNPNMPLRGFLYFADLYRKMIQGDERLYSSTLLRIPNPKYIVFYNGTDRKIAGGVQKLRLSDAFETIDTSGEYEWAATLININVGANEDLFQKCKPLKDYSMLVQRVRDNLKTSLSLEEAMKKSVDDCIRDDILKDFLEQYGKEVTGMCLTEFDEEKFRQMMIEEGREEGIALAKRTNAKNLIGLLPDEVIAEKIGLPLEEVQKMHR
ncbi:MAG: hypothetical protein J6B96_01210 [Agathobacter sp.]|nr:hypothetical protein [Agathobacter sp.]